jgi:hypothetical protein
MTVLDLLTDLFDDAIAVLCYTFILWALYASGLVPITGWGEGVMESVREIGPVALLLATTGTAAGMKFLIDELGNSRF